MTSQTICHMNREVQHAGELKAVPCKGMEQIPKIRTVVHMNVPLLQLFADPQT